MKRQIYQTIQPMTQTRPCLIPSDQTDLEKTQEDLSQAQGMAKSITFAAKNVYENMLN